MGKIGDLIVRLQLKHEDYEKGLKKAEKDTQGFGATLGKIKGVGLAVWAAIGGAALKFASDFIKQSNSMQDKWENFTTKAKAAWTTFVKNVGSGAREMAGAYEVEVKKALILTEALQNNTEVENSIKLQKAQMAEELAALEVLMRDQTKSYDERARAAEKYINKVSPIYDQEIERQRKLRDAYVAQFGVPFIGGADRAADMVKKFLIEYGKDTTYAELGGLTFADAIAVTNQKKDWGEWMPDAQKTSIISMQQNLEKVIKKWYSNISDAQAHVIANEFVALGIAYEHKLNGEESQAIVDALELFELSLGLKDKELKRVYGILNSATAQMQTSGAEPNTLDMPAAREWGAMIEALPSITAPAMSMEVPDILPDDWLERNREKIDEALAEVARLQGITDEINRSFENAVISSLSGATQALTDCIAGIEGADATQVLSALMQPFANTMIQLGEMLIAEGLAISAFKESLKELNPYVALAAGATLLAVGAALSSGIRKLGATAGSGATTTSSAASSSTGTENIQTELTIYVKGSLKGSDIVLSGQRTLNSWAR